MFQQLQSLRCHHHPGISTYPRLASTRFNIVSPKINTETCCTALLPLPLNPEKRLLNFQKQTTRDHTIISSTSHPTYIITLGIHSSKKYAYHLWTFVITLALPHRRNSVTAHTPLKVKNEESTPKSIQLK